ncbi:MAG TPA: DUF1343 domain-containing protein [Candidatus Sulfotelmatobacter sp.]|nr:DUF1343 domain-containing protein [Candidatus Sulfotelmatobacter sp.]
MTHNESSRRVFRIRSLGVFSLGAILAGIFLSCGAAARVASSGKAGARTKTGIDVLEEENFTSLQGKRVGVITNQTGVDSRGRRTIDVLAHADGVKLVAIFSPEHGIAANADASVVANATDAATGLPIYSLYGETRRPADAMLKGIDVLVFDIQDAGVRFYTYVTTMGYCMEAAAKHKIPFFVMDRPNPLGGEIIEGPVLDPDKLSFVGYFSMPVRYAMTLGELARMFNAENKIGADLHVFEMKDWHRGDMYWMTGLSWIPPSPNLPTVANLVSYPGIEILQAGGVSVGRGTDSAFLEIGAPWIRPNELLAELKKRSIPGVSFSAPSFTPKSGPYAGQECHGVALTVTDRDNFRSMLMGLEIAEALHRLHPREFQIARMITLLGSQSTVERLGRGDSPKDIEAGWAAELERFRGMRAKYLIYR